MFETPNPDNLKASCQCIIPYTQKSIYQHLLSPIWLLEVSRPMVILEVSHFTPFPFLREIHVPGSYIKNSLFTLESGTF